MGSAPGWPPAGVAPCSRAGERRAGSSSLYRFPRSTGDPDGFSAPSASPSARTRVRYSPLPHPWPAPPVRTLGHDLDGQLNGPAADGTDCSQIPVFRGGPQSFASALAGNLAPGNPAPAAGLGSGHQSAPGGLRRQLRSAAKPDARLARDRTGCRVSRVSPSAASAPHRFGHPRLSTGHFTRVAAALPVHSIVLPVCPRGRDPSWRAQGHLARHSPSRPLSSVSSGRVRPCSLRS